MHATFDVIDHHDLSSEDVSRLRRLFDREYSADYGTWDPDLPYGYSPADVHVFARSGVEVVGHVGFQKRTISVGGQDVRVAGTGGVLVDEIARGSGLGRQLLHRAQRSMREDPELSFGYLGCRPEVVRFYESAGWMRIHAVERHTARMEPSRLVESTTSPILICPVSRAVQEWPVGDIDLRGGAW